MIKYFFYSGNATPDSQQSTSDWVHSTNSYMTNPQSPQYDTPQSPLDDDNNWESPEGLESDSPSPMMDYDEDENDDSFCLTSYEPLVSDPPEDPPNLQYDAS